MKKLRSIIIPSYNMEKYLPKCLGSLVGLDDLRLDDGLIGDWRDALDIIVVNDGSKDKTSEIAHEWGRRVSEKVKGAGRTLDEAIGNAQANLGEVTVIVQHRRAKKEIPPQPANPQSDWTTIPNAPPRTGAARKREHLESF